MKGAALRRIALGTAICAIVGTHAPVIGYKVFANVDESYALALAERLNEGFKLYEGAISQRGPLMYYTYALIARTFGWDNVVALRCVALAFALVQLVLVYYAARRLLGTRGTIFATLASAYGLSIGLPSYDRFALNGELLQVPALILAVLLPTLALRHAPIARAPIVPARARLLILLGGVFLGAAICVKQSVALHALPVLVFMAARARSRGALRRTALDVAAYALGLCAIPAAFLIHARATGTLDALLYYTVQYNVSLHVGAAASFTESIPALGRELETNPIFGISLVVVGGAWAPAIARVVRDVVREKSARPLMRRLGSHSQWGLQLVVGIASAASLRRFFPHYFIPALPFLALSIGVITARITRSLPDERVSHATLVLVTALFLIAGMEGYQLEKIDAHVAHDRATDRLARWVTQTTAPQDRIFVWGFSPWLYAYSHRRPAGRFVFETYPTGFIPWFHEDIAREKARAVPGSMEALISDLDREKPELVIDAGAIMIARSMRVYEAPSAWLHEHYCFEVRVPGFDVYRRKKDAVAICPSRFPEPQRSYDYAGRPLDVPMPKTVDALDSDWLFQKDAALPAWFPNAPRPPSVELLVDAVDEMPTMRLDGAMLPSPPREEVR